MALLPEAARRPATSEENVMGKMSGEMAKYFEKKGKKGLAAHERREAAGKEKDTKARAKQEERAMKGAPKKLREYEKKEHKEMGFKRGGAIRMADGGMNPRMSRGFGPGIAAGMGRGSPSVPGTMMAKGGGVESKAKNSAKMVKMAGGGTVRGKGAETKGSGRGKFV